MQRTGHLTAVFLIALAASGCVTPAAQPLATTTAGSRAKEFKARAGVGTVYLYTGVVRQMASLWQKGEEPLRSPADFYVNGSHIGGLNNDQFFLLTLKPGTYQITWKERSDYGEMSTPFALAVAPGEQYFLRSVFDKRTADHAGVWFGAIGALATAGTIRHHLEIASETGRQDIMARALVTANKYVTAPELPSSAQPSPTEKAAPIEGTKSAGSVETRLRDLKVLHDKGLITKDEYDRKRRQIIDAM